MATVQIVIGSVVKQVERLFLAIPTQRNTGHKQDCDKLSQLLTLSSVCQTRPSEDILISGAVHVTRVKVVGLRVKELVGNDHLVPSGNKVDVDIVSHLQVTVHTKESTEGSIDGVVECCRVKTGDTFLSQEVFPLILGKLNRLSEVGRFQGGCSSSTDIKRPKSVTTGNFTRNEEIILVELSSTLSSRVGPFSHEVNSDLSSLVDTNTINIECFNGETTKTLQLGGCVRAPFSKTVLDGSEFGELSLPIGATKG